MVPVAIGPVGVSNTKSELAVVGSVSVKPASVGDAVTRWKAGDIHACSMYESNVETDARRASPLLAEYTGIWSEPES